MGWDGVGSWIDTHDAGTPRVYTLLRVFVKYLEGLGGRWKAAHRNVPLLSTYSTEPLHKLSRHTKYMSTLNIPGYRTHCTINRKISLPFWLPPYCVAAPSQPPRQQTTTVLLYCSAITAVTAFTPDPAIPFPPREHVRRSVD